MAITENNTKTLLFIAFLSIGAGRHALHAASAPSDIIVSMTREKENKHILKGSFSIDIPKHNAWDVIADYDKIDSFVSTVRSSKKIHEDNSGMIVEQVMVGRAGLLRKKIYLLLEIEEKEEGVIEFKDISGKSFRSYEGSWKISGDAEHAVIHYTLEAVPAFFSPDFLTAGAFKKSVKHLLTEVRDEMMKRYSHQ